MYKIGKISAPTVIQQCQSNWTTSPFFRRYICVASITVTMLINKENIYKIGKN